MARIYMVRHGEASATFSEHHDPGLSTRGREQAIRTAHELRDLGPLQVFSSPMQRTQETASELARLWKVTPTIENRIAEVPSPTHDLTNRSIWLRQVMGGTWQELSKDLQQWRLAMINCLLEQSDDCVMFSHFVAINILAGAATGVDELISFRPDYASITIFTNDSGTLELVQKGAEADTRVN